VLSLLWILIFFGCERLFHKKDRALVLFGSLKRSKIHPFCIVLYFFGLKGLGDEKGITGVFFKYLFRLSKIEKDRVVLVVKLVKMT